METIDQQQLANMPIDEFKQYIQKLKTAYDQLRSKNNDYNEKLHRQARKEQRIKEQQKQAVLQAETVNMMTKYQLVFVKMENAFGKVFHSNKLRNLKYKQEVFNRIKRTALSKQSQLNYKTHLVFEKFRNQILRNLINIYHKRHCLMKNLFIQKWKLEAKLPMISKECENKLKKEILNLQQKQSNKEAELKEKYSLIKEKEQDYNTLQQRYKQLQKQINELEDKERQISQEIQNLIYNNTKNIIGKSKSQQSNVQIRAEQLQQQLQTLRKENKSLKQKLEMTEVNMQSFIQEMGSLLDQHELKDVVNDILLDQNIDEERFRNEGGGSTGGSIRRTQN